MRCSDNTPFFLPFVELFVVTYPGVAEKLPDLLAVCLEQLGQSWTTYYGVARVVTAACSTDLPESRGAVAKTPLHLFAFWGSFLFFSPFGDAVCNLTPAEEPAALGNIFVRLQRFFFKLCELRKATCEWRRRWREPWRLLEDRMQWVMQSEHVLVLPIFSSDSQDKWTTLLAAIKDAPTGAGQVPAVSNADSRMTAKAGRVKVKKKPSAARRQVQAAIDAVRTNARKRRSELCGAMSQCPTCKSNVNVRIHDRDRNMWLCVSQVHKRGVKKKSRGLVFSV